MTVQKFDRGCPDTQTPTQNFKSRFRIFSSQEIGSSLVLLKMIFEALQSELFIKFHLLGSKIKKYGIQPNYNEQTILFWREDLENTFRY